MVQTQMITLDSDGGFATINVTDPLRELLAASGIRAGLATVYYQHTTGGVLVTEQEAGVLADLEDVLQELIPVERDYRHHLRAVDFNGHAHIRAALFGPSVTIPVADGQLLLGRYQEILVLDMQTERAPRSVVLQILGE
jgi:secondary thiamine-phosphate synthase enzyme